jgi:hypothetical protein
MLVAVSDPTLPHRLSFSSDPDMQSTFLPLSFRTSGRTGKAPFDELAPSHSAMLKSNLVERLGPRSTMSETLSSRSRGSLFAMKGSTSAPRE